LKMYWLGFVLLAIVWQPSTAVKCKVTQPPTESFDCSMKIDNAEVFQQQCYVQIQNGTTTAGCLPKQMPASSCGTSMQIDGKTMKICCCDTDNCNDDAFINNCRGGTVPPINPSGFTCYTKFTENSVVRSSGDQDCTNKLFGENVNQCMVMRNVNGSQIQQHQGCVAKGVMERRCNTTSMDKGATIKICCCDTQKCNGNDFVAQCLADKPTTTTTTSTTTTTTSTTSTTTTADPNGSNTMTASLFVMLMTTIVAKALL